MNPILLNVVNFELYIGWDPAEVNRLLSRVRLSSRYHVGCTGLRSFPKNWL
jgi:hypothetical protein